MLLMDIYHVQTAFLIAAMVFTIMPMITWFSLLREKSRAVNVWTAGSLVTSVGLYLIGLRDQIPDPVSYGVGVIFTLLGNALHLQALNMEDGARHRGWPWLIAALTIGCIKEWVRVENPDTQAHFLLGYGCLIIIWSQSTYYAWHVSQTEQSLAGKWLAGMHVIAVLTFAWRFTRAWLGVTHGNAIEQGFDGVMVTLTVIFISIISNVAIIGLYLERAQARALQGEIDRERHRINAELTNDIAALDRQRSMGELAASLAHELGQPITGLLMDSGSMQHALRRSPLRPQELHQIVLSMEEQAQRASQILKGIRGFMQPATTQFVPVDLLAVVHSVRQILGPVIADKGIGISVSSQGATVPILGDFVQLSQVLLNLMRNSIQARRPQERLHLHVQVDYANDAVRLTLEDNGQGLNDEQLAQFGEPFWTTKPDGLGIGVAISHRIMALHRGTLTANRPDVGPGLRVVLTFPRP